MNILFDTNIFVSAFLNSGNCFEVLDHALHNHGVFYSEYILREFEKTMLGKFRIQEKSVRSFCSFIERFFIKAEESSEKEKSCRDPNDDQILADALANQIDLLITGDKDLLILKKHHAVRIISPSQYWNL